MKSKLLRLLQTIMLCAWLAGCGGMGGEDPITAITATNLKYGQTATLTLSGNALDNGITVTSDKCSFVMLGAITSSKSRQGSCFVTGTGTATFTVKSSSGYVVYTSTLDIPSPVTAIAASNLQFGQQATVTLSGDPQNSSIGLSSDKCINMSLAAVGTSATRTATCTVVGTGAISFKVTGVYSSAALYSTQLNAPAPTELRTYNNKYGQSTYVSFPTNGLSGLTLTSTGCDSITMHSGNDANALSGSCTISRTGTVQFNVQQSNSSVVQTASLQIPEPQVTVKTSLGDFVMELNPTAAPKSVTNFLSYVNKSPSFYNGTIFHRVEPTGNYVVQAGGYTSGMVAKTGLAAPIDLESNNGLRNLRYSVGMARSTAVKSATSQFYVNLRDNTGFDYVSESAPGYAVFGRIVSGTDVIDLIASKPTKQGTTVPVTDITITSATQTQ